MLQINPKMVARLDELEEDLQVRRKRAAAEHWLGEIDGIDLTLTFLRAKRDEALRLSRRCPRTLRCGSGKIFVDGDHRGAEVGRSAYRRRRWAIRMTRWRRSGTPVRPAIRRFWSLTSVMRPSLTPEL